MQTMEKTLRPVQVQFLGPTPRQTAVSAPGEEEEGAKDDALSSDDDNFQDPLVDTANDAKKSKPARKRATKSRAKVSLISSTDSVFYRSSIIIAIYLE